MDYNSGNSKVITKSASSDFERITEYIKNDIMIADAAFYIFCKLEELTTKDDVYSAMNNSKCFWQVFLYSSFNTTLLIIARLFEKGDGFSIRKYLNYIEQHAEMVDVDNQSKLKTAVANYKKWLEEHKTIIDKIYGIRNKSIVHNDKKTIKQALDLIEQNELTIGEIKELIEYIKTVLSDICLLYDGRVINLEATNRDDYRGVIMKLVPNHDNNIL